MIAVLDVNTLWRRKFAEALARRMPGTVLAAPYAVNATAAAMPGDLAIALPPGWAGALAGIAMPVLRRRIERVARRRGDPLRTMVLTTPHYRPLLRGLSRDVAAVYYASDDYRSYAGWNAERMARDERAVCRAAALSIFVSEALRTRAVREYALDPARTFVSPNATEPRFATPSAPPPAIAALPRPVFGTAGMLNPRIDLAFLARVAADARVGSLALVGPVEPSLEDDPALATLRASDKVHFFGSRPHADMPAWMAAFDVAVIPYADAVFNHFCSPMRLYDHLAIGRPIIATSHCPQVADHPCVIGGSAADVPDMIGRALAARRPAPQVETWDDRIAALQESAVAAPLFRQ